MICKLKLSSLFHPTAMLRSLVAALLLPAALATNSSINATNATRAPAALCCALEMADSYGDGWDGVTIEIATNASALIASGLTVETDAASFEGACFGATTACSRCRSSTSRSRRGRPRSAGSCAAARSPRREHAALRFDWAALVAAWAADGYGLVGGAFATAVPTAAPTASHPRPRRRAPSAAPTAPPGAPRRQREHVRRAPARGRGRARVRRGRAARARARRRRDGRGRRRDRGAARVRRGRRRRRWARARERAARARLFEAGRAARSRSRTCR